jgi:putative transposase
MPHRKEQFVNNEIYHLTLKGIDDNLMFKDINDYYRGIFSIYEFNNLKPVSIHKKRELRVRFKEGRGRTSSFIDERDKMVEVLVFCLMANHIHLLVRQIKDNGITEFMRKIGTGYGGYFNKKYHRQGHVFQNRFHAVRIENDDQLKVAFTYIHTNPLSIAYPKWKEIRIENSDEAIKFLEKYKWSSCLDYIGIKNFPSVIEKDFIIELMGGEQECKDFIKYWIEYKGESKEYSDLFLE